MTCTIYTDEHGDSLFGPCGSCRRVVDNYDEDHRVTPIAQGGRGVECVHRGDINRDEAQPLGWKRLRNPIRTAALLRRMAGFEPLTRSYEGLDDGCFFCDADVLSERGPKHFASQWIEYAVHKPDCPWVLARRLLGIDLGHHQVEDAR